ncbi:MAG: tetratricopeptide repeat protein [Anaerolineae bacterium]|nr:tetratricopeptide repeat protein [Anaerolineae bacterium]
MLRLYLLGGLHITLDDLPVRGFVSTKSQALLCYLALAGRRPQSRSMLAALFWGDMPDEDAATNLRQAVANLKRLLEPYLVITRQTLAFNREAAYWIDVEQFEQQHDVSLYRGEFMAGLEVADASSFDEWLTVERERQHDLAVTMLDKQAKEVLDAGEDAAALTLLNRLLALDPLREETYRQLMLLAARGGNRNAAITQFEACKQRLAEELGVEPETETVRLYERIKTAHRIAALPFETTPFVGRERELAELSRRLNDAQCRMVTIVGLGGMGKTRLAVRAAHQAQGRFLHGVTMVQLAGVTTLQGLFIALMAALGMATSSTGDLRTQLINFLRDKHLLLVLDNFEQLVNIGTNFLTELLRTSVELKLVVTSRERLNLHSEWLIALDGLAYTSVEASPALDLFWQTMKRTRGDAALTAANIAAATKICRLVDGMPLAIELAAAWTRLLTCEEIADEISANLNLLQADHHDVEERHRSLQAVFDHSWVMIAPKEQQVLMALAVCQAGFTREAAEQVAGATLPLLLALVDKTLVRRDEAGRFSMHEMTRQYLLGKLAATRELDANVRVHMQYFAQFVQQREGALQSAGQIAALHEIAADLENIHAAWRTAISQRDKAVLGSMMYALSMYYDRRSLYRLGEEMFRPAVAALEHADSVLCGRALAHLALFCARVDNLAEAVEFAMLSQRVLSQTGSAPETSQAVAVLGLVETDRGHFETARDYFRQVITLRRANGDDWGVAQGLLQLSGIEWRAQQVEEAQRITEQGLQISERLGSASLIANFQTALAIIAANTGELARAKELHEAALRLYAQADEPQNRAVTYDGLAAVAYFSEDYAQAQHYYELSLQIYRDLGSQVNMRNDLHNLGEIAAQVGDVKAARRYFAESIAISVTLGDEATCAETQSLLDALQQD